jgi:cation diffusion facilitator CzcD-associated flavoprotein CzcO
VSDPWADRANIAIVGAGPAGSALAVRLGAMGVPGVVLWILSANRRMQGSSAVRRAVGTIMAKT